MSERQSPGVVESRDPTDDQGQTQPPNAMEPLKQSRMASLFSTLVIVFMVAIVVIPLFYTSLSDEVGRWRLAAAWEQRLDGELETAISTLNSALELDPNHLKIYLQRAEWYDQLGDHEAALRDYNKVNELADNDRRMLLGRAMVYHRMGKPAESIRDLEQLLEGSRGANRAIAWNLLAYLRALNSTDLDQALSDIDKSIDKIGPAPALLDTRGFIRYQLGEFEAARDDLEEAVEEYSRDLGRHRQLEGGNRIVDLRVYQLELHAAKEALAVVVYHRGMIYEKLGELNRAKADFDQVRDLGFEPNEDLY